MILSGPVFGLRFRVVDLTFIMVNQCFAIIGRKDLTAELSNDSGSPCNDNAIA